MLSLISTEEWSMKNPETNKKPYERPAIVIELDVETRAGTALFDPLNPLGNS